MIKNKKANYQKSLDLYIPGVKKTMNNSTKFKIFGGGVLLEIYLKILLIVSYTLRKMGVRYAKNIRTKKRYKITA